MFINMLKWSNHGAYDGDSIKKKLEKLYNMANM